MEFQERYDMYRPSLILKAGTGDAVSISLHMYGIDFTENVLGKETVEDILNFERVAVAMIQVFPKEERSDAHFVEEII